MAREGTKRQKAIDLMAANEDLPMAVVVGVIAKECDLPYSAARTYYRWIVANELAPGVVEDARLSGIKSVVTVEEYEAEQELEEAERRRLDAEAKELEKQRAREEAKEQRRLARENSRRPVEPPPAQKPHLKNRRKSA